MSEKIDYSHVISILQADMEGKPLEIHGHWLLISEGGWHPYSLKSSESLEFLNKPEAIRIKQPKT